MVANPRLGDAGAALAWESHPPRPAPDRSLGASPRQRPRSATAAPHPPRASPTLAEGRNRPEHGILRACDQPGANKPSKPRGRARQPAAEAPGASCAFDPRQQQPLLADQRRTEASPRGPPRPLPRPQPPKAHSAPRRARQPPPRGGTGGNHPRAPLHHPQRGRSPHELRQRLAMVSGTLTSAFMLVKNRQRTAACGSHKCQ
jgi:hypothetical protein